MDFQKAFHVSYPPHIPSSTLTFHQTSLILLFYLSFLFLWRDFISPFLEGPLFPFMSYLNSNGYSIWNTHNLNYES